MTTTALLQPLPSLGLGHRVVMAPLTRLRSSSTFAPTADVLTYYQQRATPGTLLITEASPIAPETVYEHACAIFTDEQQQRWKEVVDAVHARRALISIQLWHLGRMATDDYKNDPFLKSLNKPLGIVSSSAVAAPGFQRGRSGEKLPNPTPRPLTTEECRRRVVDDYVAAATRARAAGFDFVEIHSAHGYLMDQFYCDGVNSRADEYGVQSYENRFRLITAVLTAVIKVMGGDSRRVGIRVSPTYKDSFAYQGCYDSEPEELYRRLVAHLDTFNLGYLLLSEPRWNGGASNTDAATDPTFALPIRHTWARKIYRGTLIGSSSFTPETASKAIEDGIYDAVAFGRLFISNPDLPVRIRRGAPLNLFDVRTFYTPGNKGYLDYPSLDDSNASSFPQIASSQLGAKAPSAKSKL